VKPGLGVPTIEANTFQPQDPVTMRPVAPPGALSPPAPHQPGSPDDIKLPEAVEVDRRELPMSSPMELLHSPLMSTEHATERDTTDFPPPVRLPGGSTPAFGGDTATPSPMPDLTVAAKPEPFTVHELPPSKSPPMAPPREVSRERVYDAAMKEFAETPGSSLSPRDRIGQLMRKHARMENLTERGLAWEHKLEPIVPPDVGEPPPMPAVMKGMEIGGGAVSETEALPHTPDHLRPAPISRDEKGEWIQPPGEFRDEFREKTPREAIPQQMSGKRAGPDPFADVPGGWAGPPVQLWNGDLMGDPEDAEYQQMAKALESRRSRPMPPPRPPQGIPGAAADDTDGLRDKLLEVDYRTQAGRDALRHMLDNQKQQHEQEVELWSKQLRFDERAGRDLANLHRRIEWVTASFERSLSTLTDTNV
jgi:hypothetical protein